MSKQIKKVVSLLLAMLVMTCILTACGGGSKVKDGTYDGCYHTEVNGVKRGIDVTALIEKGQVTNIIISDDSEYIVTDPENFQRMWPTITAKITLEMCGMSIDDLMKATVTLNDDGIPTDYSGLRDDWKNNNCTECTGMYILAVQDALSKAINQ